MYPSASLTLCSSVWSNKYEEYEDTTQLMHLVNSLLKLILPADGLMAHESYGMPVHGLSVHEIYGMVQLGLIAMVHYMSGSAATDGYSQEVFAQLLQYAEHMWARQLLEDQLLREAMHDAIEKLIGATRVGSGKPHNNPVIATCPDAFACFDPCRSLLLISLFHSNRRSLLLF